MLSIVVVNLAVITARTITERPPSLLLPSSPETHVGCSIIVVGYLQQLCMGAHLRTGCHVFVLVSVFSVEQHFSLAPRWGASCRDLPLRSTHGPVTGSSSGSSRSTRGRATRLPNSTHKRPRCSVAAVRSSTIVRR